MPWWHPRHRRIASPENVSVVEIRRSNIYLNLLELGIQPGLLVVIGKLGVHIQNLVLELVDERLEVVLLVLGVLDKLVLHDHLVLPLLGRLLVGEVQCGGAGGDGQVALALLLLHLAHLRGLLGLLGIDVHCLSGLC